MITHQLPFFVTCFAVLAGAGCGHIDVAPGGSPDRVLTGLVRPAAALPAGAEVVVRLIATSTPEMTRPTTSELPIPAQTAGRAPVERVLGSHTQVLETGATEVPFRIEYFAEDALLRRGLTVDARVSFGGKLRYRTMSSHVVTLSSSAYKQEIAVQAAER